MLDAALERIAEKLRQVRDRGVQPFGAEKHGMHLRPPLAPDDVTAVEDRLGVTLPEDYRAFVTRIGDGGAGPAYGLFPLADALQTTADPAVSASRRWGSPSWNGTSAGSTTCCRAAPAHGGCGDG